jgi:hypothetical protein
LDDCGLQRAEGCRLWLLDLASGIPLELGVRRGNFLFNCLLVFSEFQLFQPELKG